MSKTALTTIKSVSSVADGTTFELGDWAKDENHYVQAALHVEHWRTKFPNVTKAYEVKLGPSVEHRDRNVFTFVTDLHLVGPGIGKRHFATVVTVKEVLVP